MEKQVPQQTTRDAYNATVDNVIQQQKLNALANYNRDQPSFLPQYGSGQQSQQAGYLPSPIYSPGSNPFQTFQTIQETQQQQISDNILSQRKIRAYQSQGYDAVIAGLNLSKKASKKQNALGDTVPYLYSFINPSRRDILGAYAGEALSRIDPKYANIVEGVHDRTAAGLKKAGIILAERGLEDMLVGKIVNGTSVSPMLDAGVLEQTARSQAKAIIDAYISKLPSKRIKSESDIYKIMDMIDGFSGDASDLFELQNSLQNIALEYGYIHSYTNDILENGFNDHAQMVRNVGHTLESKKGEYLPVSASTLQPHMQASVGLAAGLLMGAFKGVASPLKSLAIDIGLNGFAAFADTLHSIFTLNPDTSYKDKVDQFSSLLDEKLASKSTAEFAGKMVPQVAIMLGMGAYFFPTASLLGQLAAGTAASFAFPALKYLGDGIIDTVLDLFLDDASRAKDVIGNMSKAILDGLFLFLPSLAKSYIGGKTNNLATAIEYSPKALEIINSMDQYTRDVFLRQLKNVSIDKVMELISENNLVEQAKQTGAPESVIYSLQDALNRNAGLRESSSILQVAKNEANAAVRTQILEFANKQRQAQGRKQSTMSGGFGELLQQTVTSVKQVVSEKYNSALGEPKPISTALIIPNRILQSIEGNNQLKWAKAGIINGLQRIIDNGDIRKAFGVEQEAAMIPVIHNLKRAINNNDFEAAHTIIQTQLPKLPHTAAHHIRSHIGKMYNEDPSQANYNRGVEQLKNEYNSIVDSTMSSKEQQLEYATAQSEWGVLQDVADTLEQFVDMKDGTPTNRATQAVNKIYEVTRDLEQIIAKFSLSDKQKDFAKELSILSDEFVTFSVVEKLKREPEMTATEISTLANKVAGAQVDEAVKAPILHALNLYQQVMKTFTTDINRTQTGVHEKQNVITQFLFDTIYALGSKIPIAPSLVSYLIKQFNVPANTARSIGTIADVFNAHPKMYAAVQAAFDSTVAKGYYHIFHPISLLSTAQRTKDDND